MPWWWCGGGGGGGRRWWEVRQDRGGISSPPGAAPGRPLPVAVRVIALLQARMDTRRRAKTLC